MPNLNERYKIIRAAGTIGIATLGSRFSGFLRDMSIACFFGASPVSDAFFVAYRLPNLLRRFFAEGAFTVAFVPTFTKEITDKGKDEAFLLARAVFPLLALLLFLVCLVGIFFAPLLVKIMAPGFLDQKVTFDLAVTLARWCFPYIFFISLAALAAGILNSLNYFFAPAASTMLLNLAMIFCVIFLAPWVEPAVLSLALGVLIGGLAQVVFQIPYLRKIGISFRPLWLPYHPGVINILKLMGPTVFGASVYQLAVLINTILASFLPSGSVSYLYYADRIVEFPLGIFGVAITTAILPTLSRQTAIGHYQILAETIDYALRISMFIHLPATVGLIVLAEPLVLLLFGWGEFRFVSVHATALALVGYSIGLWAFAGYRTLTQAFYALNDTYTPVKVGIWCLLVNFGTSLFLMYIFGHVGLAIATSISSITNMLLLLSYLKKRLEFFNRKRLLRSFLIIFLVSIIMGFIIAGIVYLPFWGDKISWTYKWLRPFIGVTIGVIAYLIIAWVFNMQEFNELKLILLKSQN